MKEIWQWINDKFDVLFSGLGVFLISLIISAIYLFFCRRGSTTNKVHQRNIIAGGDVVGRDKRGK